jgi:hypothetical protein
MSWSSPWPRARPRPMAGAGRWQSLSRSLSTDGARSGRIDRRGYRRLALLGWRRAPCLIYARLPKAHRPLRRGLWSRMPGAEARTWMPSTRRVVFWILELLGVDAIPTRIVLASQALATFPVCAILPWVRVTKEAVVQRAPGENTVKSIALTFRDKGGFRSGIHLGSLSCLDLRVGRERVPERLVPELPVAIQCEQRVKIIRGAESYFRMELRCFREVDSSAGRASFVSDGYRKLRAIGDAVSSKRQ